MSAHRAARRQRLRLGSVRLRLLLTLGLVLTPGVMGTYAAWTDTATVSGMEIKTGTLDLAVGATAGDQLTGPGGSWNYAALGLADMLPGESVARPLTIRNAGTTPLKYSGQATVSSNALNPALKLTLTPGATAATTGTQAAGNRAGTCTGGTTPWLTGVAVSTTAASFPPAPIVLQPGATTSVCVLVALDAGAGNGLQNQSVTLTIVLSASQP